MNTAFRTRLVVLLVAIVAVALLTLWGVQEAHDRIGQLESSLTEDQIRTFRIADTFHASLLRLNNHILRYAAWREPGLWDKYVQESDELKRWIDHYDSPPDQDPPQPNYAGRDREHQLIAQLNDAFDEYRCAAQAVRSNQPPARLPAETTAHFNEFERQSQRLLQLGMDLANAHGTAQKAFLADANRSDRKSVV